MSFLTTQISRMHRKKEASRSVVQFAQNIGTNIMKWTMKDCHIRSERRSEPSATEQIAEDMRRVVFNSLITTGKLDPSNIIRINVPKEFIEPLWCVIKFEDYIVLVIRGTWSFGDVITDATATTKQVYNPPIPPTQLLLSEKESIKSVLPKRFRDITLEEFDEIKKRMKESSYNTPEESFMNAARTVLKSGKENQNIFEDDSQKVEEYYAHEGFILASSFVYYTSLPLIQHVMDSGKKLVVTGHSLGAGIAPLVGLYLRRLYPSVHVFSFAPPASVSLRMSIDMRNYVTSFILMNDIVPRLSVYSTSKMLQTIEAHKKGKQQQHQQQQDTKCTDREQLTLESHDTLLPPGKLYHITYRDAPRISTRSKLLKERTSSKIHKPLTPSTTDMVLEYEEEKFSRVSELPLLLTSILDHRPLDYSLSLLEICLAFGALPQSHKDLESIGWF